MATVQQVLDRARSQIGYSRWDDPLPGTVYGRWYAEQVGEAYYGTSGVPYCAMFVSWVLGQCGVRFLYAYCPYIIRDFASRAVAKKDARAGDVVLFDWGRDGVADHVGLVESNAGDHLVTIEGNTSSGTSGSQSNGGRVARRTRSFGHVKAVIRLDYEGMGEDMSQADVDEIKRVVHGIEDYLTSPYGVQEGQAKADVRTRLGYMALLEHAVEDEVTRRDDPTGRGVEMTTHEHLKWVAKKQADMDGRLEAIGELVVALCAKAGVEVPDEADAESPGEGAGADADEKPTADEN